MQRNISRNRCHGNFHWKIIIMLAVTGVAPHGAKKTSTMISISEDDDDVDDCIQLDVKCIPRFVPDVDLVGAEIIDIGEKLDCEEDELVQKLEWTPKVTTLVNSVDKKCNIFNARVQIVDCLKYPWYFKKQNSTINIRRKYDNKVENNTNYFKNKYLIGKKVGSFKSRIDLKTGTGLIGMKVKYMDEFFKNENKIRHHKQNKNDNSEQNMNIEEKHGFKQTPKKMQENKVALENGLANTTRKKSINGKQKDETKVDESVIVSNEEKNMVDKEDISSGREDTILMKETSYSKVDNKSPSNNENTDKNIKPPRHKHLASNTKKFQIDSNCTLNNEQISSANVSVSPKALMKIENYKSFKTLNTFTKKILQKLQKKEDIDSKESRVTKVQKLSPHKVVTSRPAQLNTSRKTLKENETENKTNETFTRKNITTPSNKANILKKNVVKPGKDKISHEKSTRYQKKTNQARKRLDQLLKTLPLKQNVNLSQQITGQIENAPITNISINQNINSSSEIMPNCTTIEERRTLEPTSNPMSAIMGRGQTNHKKIDIHVHNLNSNVSEVQPKDNQSHSLLKNLLEVTNQQSTCEMTTNNNITATSCPTMYNPISFNVTHNVQSTIQNVYPNTQYGIYPNPMANVRYPIPLPTPYVDQNAIAQRHPPGLCDVLPSQSFYYYQNVSPPIILPPPPPPPLPLLPPPPIPKDIPERKDLFRTSARQHIPNEPLISSVIGKNIEGLIHKIHLANTTIKENISSAKSVARVLPQPTSMNQNTPDQLNDSVDQVKANIKVNKITNKMNRSHYKKPGPLSKTRPGTGRNIQKGISSTKFKGYSPPILPIPTFKSILSQVEINNSIEKQITTTGGTITAVDGIKKISLNEYKKRI